MTTTTKTIYFPSLIYCLVRAWASQKQEAVSQLMDTSPPIEKVLLDEETANSSYIIVFVFIYWNNLNYFKKNRRTIYKEQK